MKVRNEPQSISSLKEKAHGTTSGKVFGPVRVRLQEVIRDRALVHQTCVTTVANFTSGEQTKACGAYVTTVHPPALQQSNMLAAATPLNPLNPADEEEEGEALNNSMETVPIEHKWKCKHGHINDSYGVGMQVPAIFQDMTEGAAAEGTATARYKCTMFEDACYIVFGVSGQEYADAAETEDGLAHMEAILAAAVGQTFNFNAAVNTSTGYLNITLNKPNAK